MKKSLNKYEFFILLEPFIEELELNSPLNELILDAPLEQWDSLDIEAKKKELELIMDEDNFKNFKEIVHILTKPAYFYTISLQIDDEKYLNEVYERDNKVVEYLFNEKEAFLIKPPLSHKQKLLNYIKLIDKSEYELDYVQPKHILDYDEYLVLNLAFSLEEMSRSIGIVEDGTFLHFTSEDIIDESKEEANKYIHGLSLFFRDEEKLEEPINITLQVDSLLNKGYLTSLDDGKMTIGNKATILYENLYVPNEIQFSFSNMKYIGNTDDAYIKYGMFRCTSRSAFYFYFENRKIVIETISGGADLEKTFMKAFNFDEFE